MNQINTAIIGILLFSPFIFIYIPLNEVLTKIGTQEIHIVNNLDVHLEFKEIKK